MKKEFWLIIIMSIIIVVLAGILFFWPKSNNQPPADIEVFLPKTGEEISSPVKITGIVRGNGWTGFEGQVGTVELLDSNSKTIASGVLTATTEWTSLPTSFETTLNFQSPAAQSGTLVFRNENASGLPEKNKTFTIPVKIAKIETMMVSVFFNGGAGMGNYECENVSAVGRLITKTTAPARATLEELLKGPTDAEKVQHPTSINPGVKIQSLTIDANGTAKVDFDEQLQYQVGGSCRVSAIRAQITQTLKQFPTVKNVIISINGRIEDILQP